LPVLRVSSLRADALPSTQNGAKCSTSALLPHGEGLRR
jgi:hypothetical protein